MGIRSCELYCTQISFIFNLLSYVADMINIEEDDFEWFGLFSKTVCGIAKVYKYLCTVLECATERNTTQIPETLDKVQLDVPHLMRFRRAFLDKVLCVIKKISNCIKGAELPYKDIHIIHTHYDDMAKLIRLITDDIILPPLDQVGLMQKNYIDAVELNNELLVRKLPVGCKM